MLKRCTSFLLAFLLVILCFPMQAFAAGAAGAASQPYGIQLLAGGTYVFENNGAEDADVTVLGSLNPNVRADWIILSGDGTERSHGNYGYMCYLDDSAYTLAPGEKMIVSPIRDHDGNPIISFNYGPGISVTPASEKPITRYRLRKGQAYSFVNNTDTVQSFFCSGDISPGVDASANIYADYVFVDAQNKVGDLGCGNILSFTSNALITLLPGERGIIRPLADSTGKDYVVAYTLNYGLPCDVKVDSNAEDPIRRINLQKGYDYTIVNNAGEDLPIYFSGAFSALRDADVSANIKADYSVYENGTLVSEAWGRYLSYTGNSEHTIHQNQLWKITPISDHYSYKDYVVAFVPYTIDEYKLTVSVDNSTRYNVPLTNVSLTVYENKHDSGKRVDSYRISYGAQVITDEATHLTNAEGIVIIPTLEDGTFTVKKEGYITRTFTAGQLKVCQRINLQQVSKGSPVVSGVWIGNTDVLNQSCPVGLLSKEETTLDVEIDWGKSSYGGIELMQDARTVKFTGTTLTTVLSEHFDVSEPIYIVATDAEGNTTKKPLKFESGTASAVPNILDGAGFTISDKISITLPDDIKPDFFAGQKISVGVSSLVPVTISAEDGKVYVAIGVDLVNYESENKFASNSSGDKKHVLSGKFRILHKETERYVNQFKNTGILSSGGAASSFKKLKNLEQTYKTAIKYPQGSFGFDANFTILGFAEGYYDAQGNVTWLDGGVILNPSVAWSLNLPFSLGPVPMYFEAALSADIQAQLNIMFNEAAKNFTPNGEISGTIALSGGVGFGVKKVLYGGGGLEGKLMPDWHIYDNAQDYFKLSASINAYAKVGIAIFEYKKNWEPFANAVWIEYPKADAASASLMSGSDIYDTANYQVKDLSYLNGGSEFAANGDGGAALMSSGESREYLTVHPFKTNVYRESTPQIVLFEDGTELAVWPDADSGDINNIVLYYSRYDGTAWSDPAVVHQDGTLDYTPKLTLIGNTAYLVWQNGAKTFAVEDSLEEIAPHFDVSLAVFDPENGFAVSTVTSPGLDMLPTVCGDENAVYLVWVKNGENDWFGNNNANSICYSAYENGALGEMVTAYPGLNAIDSVAANYNGTLDIAYCLDTDGDLTTSDDVRLYKNGARVSSAEVSEALPQYAEDVLFWNSGGLILSEAGTETSEIAVGNYQILEKNGARVLVYTTSNGLTSTLNASYFNRGTQMWCEPYALTDGSAFIGAFSADVTEDGILEVFITSQEVTGSYEDDDPYGEAQLTYVTLEPYCDLAVGELVYSDDWYNAGDAMELGFALTNCGSQVVSSVTITVSDDQGEKISSVRRVGVIVPGQTVDLSACFKVDEGAAGQDIIVTVTPDGLTDVNDTDNSRSAALAFEDLSVERAHWGVLADGTKTLSADIVNYGHTARQNIEVELREGSVDGPVAGTATIESLDVLALDVVSFALAEQKSEVYFIAIKDSGDLFTANDHNYVAVLPDEPDCITVDWVSEDSAQLYLENEQAGTCAVAIYDGAGKLLTLGTAEVAEQAGEVTVSYEAFTCETEYTAKVFLVDSAYVPICQCAAKGY